MDSHDHSWSTGTIGSSQESPKVLRGPKSDPIRRRSTNEAPQSLGISKWKLKTQDHLSSPFVPRAPHSTPTASGSGTPIETLSPEEFIQPLSQRLSQDYSSFNETPRERFNFFLHKTPIAHIPSQYGTVIAIDSKSTIEDAIVLLGGHGIFSAPVYIEGTGDFVGMIGMDDIANSFLKNDLSMIPFILTQPVTQIIDMTKGKIRTISERESLEYLLRAFSEGYHRVLVVNIDNELQHVLSQSTVLAYLIQNYIVLEHWLFKSVRDLGLVNPNVTSVKNTSTIRDALKILLQSKMEAIAVLDRSERVVGSFATSHLKKINQENASLLMKSVDEFLSIMELRKLTICSEVQNLATVILMMGVDRAHQVWVVDKKQKLIGMISISDFLHRILETQGATPAPPRKRDSRSFFTKKLETSPRK